MAGKTRYLRLSDIISSSGAAALSFDLGNDSYLWTTACLPLPGTIMPKKERLRIRPTGESGSGPYFNAYKRSSYGDVGVRVSDTFTDVLSGVVDKYSGLYHYHWDIGPDSTLVWVYSGYKGRFQGDIIRYIGPEKKGTRAGHSIWYYSQTLRCSDEYEGLDTFLQSAEAYFRAGQPRKWVADETVRSGICQSLVSRGFHFRYREPSSFEWYQLTGSFYSSTLNAMATTAYIQAVEAVPQANANSIANLLEVVNTIKDLLRGRGSLPTSLKDGWLSYRYGYCTSQSDLRAYADISRRLLAISDTTIRCDGYCRHGDIEVHCMIDVNIADALPANLKGFLETYGFKLTLANFWDMVPYSFIVDWFIPIGDWLGELEAYGNAFSFQPSASWTSVTTEYDGQKTYFRVPGHPPMGLPYQSTWRAPSEKTILMRIADAFALFF